MREREVRAYNAQQVAVDSLYKILDNIAKGDAINKEEREDISEQIEQYNDDYILEEDNKLGWSEANIDPKASQVTIPPQTPQS